MRWVALASLVLALAPDALAVKSQDFKTCSQSGFCRRGRALSTRAAEAKANKTTWVSPYSIDSSSLSISPSDASFTAAVKSSLYPDIKFGLELRVHEDGVVRVRMNEVDGLRKRYDEAASWALIREPEISKDITWKAGKKDVKAKYGENEVVVAFEPLKVTLLRNGKEQIVLNGEGLLHMEHFRAKEEPKKVEEGEEVVTDSEGQQEVMQQEPTVNPRAWFEGETEDDYWDEKFNSWTDTKPKGPESLSLDIDFPNHAHVYGIPQHATRLALPTTSGPEATYTDPFRLHNADVFEYLADSTMSLYGSIPLMHAHSADSTVAVFNAIGSETWIDISHPVKDKSTLSHWISESGILDVFLLPGPTPSDIFAQYARLTGTTALPAHWSLGYHQCRWNYVSSEDVRAVQKRFDEEDIPVDVFWLDIEYAEEHKYFIWDKKTFPDPVEMTEDVAASGRKMVVIIDPHLKRTSSYPVYQEASEKEFLVKNKDGGEYEGWCWSGSSSWVDCFNPAVADWWVEKFKLEKLDGRYSWVESTKDVHIWNDMNEPAIFNGPEISMHKDSIHYGGWEHRDVHNINGMLFHNLTSLAVLRRTSPPQRPFVLTRSFYAGSQRFGAMWTGDNLGTWDHMAVGIKMVLANSIAGMTFAGSDVGGFFGNPEPEMLVRWYQVGIFSPFFRAHAHIDTKRREPYLLDEPYKSIVKDILRLRYKLLPVWYTAFRETSVTGKPVVRPHYVEFPKDVKGFDLDDQFFVGSSGLLVKPVTDKGATEASVYLPAEDQVYYDYFSHVAYPSTSSGKQIAVPAALDQIPFFIRGDSIILTRERPRRSSPLMAKDPFTLTVALGKTGQAKGELYLDDGTSYAHESGDWVWREFVATTEGKKKKAVVKIESKDLGKTRGSEAVDPTKVTSPSKELSTETYDSKNAFAKSIEGVRVEKLVVLGLGSKPSSVKAAVSGEGDKELVWEWKEGVAASDKKMKDGSAASELIIKDPKVTITKDWVISVQL
ncbi:alpha-glucosidase [Dendrothele bispora CBS 962.96]|uniref:Glucosidase II subunit alpha n=1 Tax=Dendrothele bispora (strain CBS 962.96) TaxID=1314807 RepID=A0A4S8MU55_DENBC|nr:alpha-glucosidase [Dendrothele bispora CBS 962.96]